MDWTVSFWTVSFWAVLFVPGDICTNECTRKKLMVLLIRACVHNFPHALNCSLGSPSRGGDVAVYFFDINQPSLPTPFYSVLLSVSVFMALSTVFHFINSLDDSLLSHSVLPVLYLPYWSFQLYISL